LPNILSMNKEAKNTNASMKHYDSNITNIGNM